MPDFTKCKNINGRLYVWDEKKRKVIKITMQDIDGEEEREVLAWLFQSAQPESGKGEQC